VNENISDAHQNVSAADQNRSNTNQHLYLVD